MSNEEINMQSDAQVAPSDDSMEKLSEMAKKMIALNAEIAVLDKAMKVKKEEVSQLESVDIPELLEDHLKFTSITMADKSVITIKQIISASLPAASSLKKPGDAGDNFRAKMKAGLKFLRDNGAGSLITNELKIDIGNDSEELSNKLLKALEPFDVPVDHQTTVHPKRMTAYVVEQLEAGKDLPHETFSIYTGRKAVITKKKA